MAMRFQMFARGDKNIADTLLIRHRLLFKTTLDVGGGGEGAETFNTRSRERAPKLAFPLATITIAIASTF
jgi:hypothetical protein